MSKDSLKKKISLKDYFCDSLDFTFKFKAEDFDKEAFLRDTKATGDKQFAWSFGSRDKDKDLHAHISVELYDEDGSLHVIYHAVKTDVEDIRPPYVEDCAEWVVQFFKVEELDASVYTVFNFEGTHSSVLSLPFPLVTEVKGLAGSQVTGLSIDLPKGEALKRALVQTYKDNILVIGTANTRIKLKSFNLRTQLSRLSATVGKLVKPKGSESAS